MDNEKLAYKLYAWKTTQENIEQAKRFRFHRITQKYILVYATFNETVDITTENMIEHNQEVEISEDRVKYLTETDYEWLQECNVQIIREETQRNERKIIETASQSLEKLEQALIVEQKILSEGKNGSEQKAES